MLELVYMGVVVKVEALGCGGFSMSDDGAGDGVERVFGCIMGWEVDGVRGEDKGGGSYGVWVRRGRRM